MLGVTVSHHGEETMAEGVENRGWLKVWGTVEQREKAVARIKELRTYGDGLGPLSFPAILVRIQEEFPGCDPSISLIQKMARGCDPATEEAKRRRAAIEDVEELVASDERMRSLGSEELSRMFVQAARIAAVRLIHAPDIRPDGILRLSAAVEKVNRMEVELDTAAAESSISGGKLTPQSPSVKWVDPETGEPVVLELPEAPGNPDQSVSQ